MVFSEWKEIGIRPMILRQCIYASSHLETALQMASENPEHQPLLDALKHALEEIKVLQNEIAMHARNQNTVVTLSLVVTDRAG